MREKLYSKYKKIKYTKLVAALTIDMIGNASYVIPVLGEVGDVFWGLISSGIMIFALFPNDKLLATGGAVEEILPGTDFIPTATFLWIKNYWISNDKSFAKFVRKEVKQEQLIDEILSTKVPITEINDKQ